MNVILLIFIILAMTFIAGSANNMVSVVTAVDSFFGKAEVPDYWYCLLDAKEAENFENFARENGYELREQQAIQLDSDEVRVDGRKFDYSNSICLSQLKNSTRIFDSEDREITEIKDGEIYVTAEIFRTANNDFRVGTEMEITAGGKTKTFIVKGATKDAMFGSAMVGITRVLISENDYAYFNTEDAEIFYSMCVYTDDSGFVDKVNELGLNSAALSINRSGIKVAYIMDMVIAGIMLVVSVCLILISMVILHFTIHFTMSEEFRETGVMKAIGIGNSKIRGLYIAKYLAISVMGGMIGLALSLPFGELMLGNLSDKIILSGEGNYVLNVVSALAVVAAVFAFCYFCTRRVKSFSPIDAIRNGENGERYVRKSVISLSRFRLPPICFLAVNDIFCGIKRFLSMLVIFTLGMLLIIIPVNTINTLQSDQLIRWFNMSECGHIIDENQLIDANGKDRGTLEEHLNEIRARIAEEGIEADVFKEIMFKMNISYQGKKTTSIAFQGVGDITTDQYAYLEGTAPGDCGEVAISHLIAEKLGADIGDTVEIKNGEETKKYMVTAIYQTMNNMGEGIRFYQEEPLDYNYAMGGFGTQISYTDDPDGEELEQRKEMLRELFPEDKILSAGEYINEMIGDVAGQLQGVKQLILLVVLFINILVTVLMVKSFLIREKGEIAMLKAMGFKNSSLIAWQTLRIGIILFLAVIIGTMLGEPVSQLSVEPIFEIMGAQSIEFTIVPWEVYVMYPLIVLGVTVFAAMLAALQVRKIHASDTAGME